MCPRPGNLDWGLGSIENYLDGNGQLQSRVTFARMDRFNRTNHVKDQKGLFLPTSRPHPNQGDHSGTGNGIHLSLVRHFRNEVHRWMDGFIQIMALILRRKKDLRMRYVRYFNPSHQSLLAITRTAIQSTSHTTFGNRIGTACKLIVRACLAKLCSQPHSHCVHA